MFFNFENQKLRLAPLMEMGGFPRLAVYVNCIAKT
jgi:hypothetical protein